MTTIEKTISAEAITGFKRVARHENFVILPDLNMVQQVRIVTLDENGVPIAERVEKDENLTPAQRQAALARYQDQLVTKQTAGAFVSAKTGQVVAGGTEGAVPQREFFQAITIGNLKAMGMPVTDKTPVIGLIYAMIGGEIGNIDARGDL